MTGEKRVSDVNLIPKKEAISYFESNIPRDSGDAEVTRILIELIELGLVAAVYQKGHIAYQAIEMDPFKAFVTILSTMSEQKIKTILPDLRKLTEECKEELKTPFKKGTISESISKILKNISDIKALMPISNIKYLKNGSDIEVLNNFTDIEYLKTISYSEVLNNDSNLTIYKHKIANLLEPLYKKGYISKEVTSKILECVSILSEHETRTPNTNINEKIMEIKKLLEEEERKILEEERLKNQFIELFEKVPNNSVPELKKTLSEVRKKLEEK